jgi:hypothetical protein
MNKKYWVAALLLVIAIPVMSLASSKSKRERILAEKKRHIEANVPDKADFDIFMRRDLVKYFKETTGKQFKVDYELLREKPFQAGKKYPMAYPLFYVWIGLYENDKLVDKGAARVRAIEKKRFEVVTFADKKRIERDTYDAIAFFPIDVSAMIVEEKIKE